MLFELNFRCNFDFGKAQMSVRSQQLAAYVRRFVENQPIQDEATVIRNRILDGGFAALRDELKRECEQQVEELNKEPGCANFLVCRFSDSDSGVFRADDGESFLSLKFDPAKRTAKLICKKPTKFDYVVEVRLNTGNTGWYFVAGENRRELSPCNTLDWIVDKGLFALVGVET